jgi:predicted phosphodiesterase
MQTLRWLHLSDFHTGKDGYGENHLFQYILNHIRDRASAGMTPDVIFITGDIANKGKQDQYERFYEKFFLPLIELLPSISVNRIFIIPGNHDVDRDQSKAFVPYDVLLHTEDFLDSNEIGQFRREIIRPRFLSFAKNDMTHGADISKHWLFSEGGAFTRVLSFNDQKVGILGLNSAWLSYSDKDHRKLSAGKMLIEDGLSSIQDCNFKIVLGHHPIDWFIDSQMEPIRSLFGKNNVLYLHGHLHKGSARYEEGAGYPFLAMQSAACFQAREHDIWINGFSWGELDFSTRQIMIEPFTWSSSYQEWKVDTSAYPERYHAGNKWIFSWPTASPVRTQTNKPSISLSGDLPALKAPDGWTFINDLYLKNFSKNYSRDSSLELDSAQILSFFDGSMPTWLEALSTQIPKRNIVSTLLADLETCRNSDEGRAVLLFGAAGEGKTTALLQTLCILVANDSNWNILWRYDATAPLPAEFIAKLPQDKAWLISSDDAETIARRVFESIQAHKLVGRKDIHFLLSCRDTDWKSEKADKWPWEHQLVERALRGLSRDDAEHIVQAWGRYGKDGLRALNGLEPQLAIDKLLQAAKPEPMDNEGSFFGAALQVRFGVGLKGHVENLIKKLDKRKIDDRTTLKDAFAYIAVLHAEGLQMLSREVLSGTLGMSPKDLSVLRRKVLRPLGEEAAIAMSGRFIFTRHRAIANAAVQVLSEKFDVEVDNLYIELVKAAREVANSGIYISRGNWDFLSSHFFDKGNHSLGIRLAKAALEVPGNEAYLIVKLAQLFREAEQPEDAVRLFRSTNLTDVPRGYYFEWSVAEGAKGNRALSVCLAAFAISDEAPTLQPPTNQDGEFVLGGLALQFSELHRNFNLPTFLEACAAAVTLSKKLILGPKGNKITKEMFSYVKEHGAEDLSPNKAFEKLKSGIDAAWDQREDELPDNIKPTKMLNFKGLTRLLRITMT